MCPLVFSRSRGHQIKKKSFTFRLHTVYDPLSIKINVAIKHLRIERVNAHCNDWVTVLQMIFNIPAITHNMVKLNLNCNELLIGHGNGKKKIFSCGNAIVL